MEHLTNCNEKCGNWKQCKGQNLYDICSCMIYDLHDKKIIHVSNGSEGLSLIEQVFNVLRHNSTDKKLRDMHDVNVLKPSEIMGAYLKGKLKAGEE